MNVLVTGHLGYIGTVLTRILHRAGHTVTGVDTGYFEDCLLPNAETPERPDRELRKDIRAVGVEDLRGIEAVVHLAALSNDPMGQLNPALTDEINHRASVELGRRAREAGVARFVFSSSCSMYGAADGDAALTEEAPFNPVSAYALSKVHAEAGLSSLACDSFSPVFLRNATAYGVSPRMRFDLVLNEFVGWALSTGKVRIKSDGTPWRPLVHVEDICNACVAALEAPREVIHNQAFNVGQDSENFQVREIVEAVREVVPGCEVEYTGEHQGDRRSYRVCFAKIRECLPDFRPRWGLRRGAKDLYQSLKGLEFSLELFQDRKYTRLKQLQYLTAAGHLRDDLFWQGERQIA
jgi:nucleoside-diphosphate-sugar epimerase